MTSRLSLCVVVIAIAAVWHWWAADEFHTTVELVKALFSLDIQIGGEQP